MGDRERLRGGPAAGRHDLVGPDRDEDAPGDHRHAAQGDEARRDVERWRVAEAEPERS
jgi:hypothetical protein